MTDAIDQHVAAWAKEVPWLDPVKEEIFLRMRLLTRHASQHRTLALEGERLKLGEYKILMVLRRGGAPFSSSPSQLAVMLGLSKGALSTRLGALEERGLVERQHEPGDRRRVRVTLTPAGRRTFEAAVSVEEANEGALLVGLTERERRTLAALLRKLTDQVNATAATG